jgi:hypothetical protein
MFSKFDKRLAALEEQYKDVVSRLQESKFQVSCLRGEILELREENAKLRNAYGVALQEQNSVIDKKLKYFSIYDHDEVIIGLYDNEFTKNNLFTINKFSRTSQPTSVIALLHLPPTNIRIFLDSLQHLDLLESFDFLSMFQSFTIQNCDFPNILFTDRLLGYSFSGNDLLSFCGPFVEKSGCDYYPTIDITLFRETSFVETCRLIKQKNYSIRLLFDACEFINY